MAERVVAFKYIVDASEAVSTNEKVEKSFDSATKAATSGGAQTAAAMTGAAQAAGKNTAQIEKNNLAIKNLDGQIRGIERTMARMEKLFNDVSRSFGLNSEQAKKAAAQIDDLAASKKRLVEQQITLVEKNQFLANGLNTTTGSASIAKQGFEKLTNNVQLFSGVLGGGNDLLSKFLSSMGGVTLGVGFLGSVVGFVVPMLIEMATAKKELIKIDQDQIALNTFLARTSEDATTRENARLASTAALTAAIENIITAQKEANKIGLSLRDTEIKLNTTTEEGKIIYNGILPGQVSRLETAQKLRDTFGELSSKEQENTKVLLENMKAVDAYRAITGAGIEATLNFARSQKIGEENVSLLRQALNSQLTEMAKYAAELAKVSFAMRTLLEIQVQYNLARGQATPPSFESRSTLAEFKQFGEEVARNLQFLITNTDNATKSAATFREAVIDQAGPLGELQKFLQQTTGSQSGYNAVLGQFPEIIRRALVELDKIDKGMDAFKDKTKAAEAAARAYANTVSTLQKELANTDSLLARSQVGDVFAARQQRADAEFADRKRDLERNKQLTEETLNLIRLIHQKTSGQIVNDNIRAYEELERRVRAINVRTIDDEFERRKAAIETLVEADIKAAQSLGLGDNAMSIRRIDFRKAREQEYFNWYVEHYRKMLDEIQKLLIDDGRKANALRQAQASVVFENPADSFQRDQSNIKNLIGKFNQGGTAGVPLDINQLNQANELMAQLGVTVQDVDTIFGSSSSSIGQFTERLNILAGSNLSTIDTLKQLIDWQQVFVQVIGLAQNAISDLVAGSDKGGKAILASFLQMIAAIASTLGTLFLLAGAGFIWIPGLNWSGTALLAAGAAMIVFAGVLGGLSQRLTKEDSASSAASGGGASSAASGGGAGGNQGRPPNVIQFPTSGGPQGGDSYTVFKLDRQGTKDFLDGNEVLTKDDATGVGRHSSSFFRSAIREAKRRAKQQRAS